MKEYQRRAAEIQLSLLVRNLYNETKNTQTIINYFRSLAKIFNMSNPEYIETAVINYKKILPTPDELARISDLAESRSRYYNSEIVHDLVGRNKFFSLLKEADPLELMESKTNPVIADILIEFITKLKELSHITDEFLIKLC